MAESTPPPGPCPLAALAADLRDQRRAALHAIHVLEYALTAPAPRRHRTWLHRVAVAVDALHAALHPHADPHDSSLSLLDEIALTAPDQIDTIARLRRDLLDLTIAVASLREQIEPDPTIEIDAEDIRGRLGVLTRQFRQHQAQEADLIFETTGLEIKQV